MPEDTTTAEGASEQSGAKAPTAVPAALPGADMPPAHPYYWADFILIGDPAEWMKHDPAFAPMRQRDDFKKLPAGLGKDKPERK